MKVLSNDVFYYTEEIDKVFKSLIKSGRPDILDEENQSIVPTLYTDLFENNYILRQVLDDNHTLLKGRRGTGKSTIFLKAEYELKDRFSNTLPIYINLQTSFENVRGSNEEEHSIVSSYITHKNFLNDILQKIKYRLSNQSVSNELEVLFREIEEGQYIDKDFERTIQLTLTQQQETKKGIGGQISLSSLSLNGDLSNGTNVSSSITIEKKEYRIFAINEILKKISFICARSDITKIYLFLDDFSELSQDSQKVVIDSLIAPIISSYNELFVVKIAAYPGRIYLGNIDKTKLPSHSLDFYDAYDQSSSTYNDMEKYAISYIRRVLERRLNHYTEGLVNLEDIFEIDDNNSLESYLNLLFNVSFSIMRSLGFILSYCYLSSINEGKKINKNHIERASQKYYDENILSDFINDARFKQSFYDDKTILDQISQKNLHDKIISNQFNMKREIIEKHKEGMLTNQLFIETLEQNKKTTVFYFPTSHFSVDKATEKLLQTLELYFIVNKFNETSARWAPGKEVSIYGLNYGLCLKNGIDYGRPQFRRTYDYWRQEEFFITDYIHETLTSIEKIKCQSCGEEYTEEEYAIYSKRRNCFECGSHDRVIKINKFEDKLRKTIQTWHERKLPDAYMDILRVLYNNHGSEKSAYEIGTEIDRYHIVVTNAMRNYLVPKEFVLLDERERRYYRISDKAVSVYFSDQVDKLE